MHTTRWVVKHAEIGRDQAPLRRAAHPNLGVCRDVGRCAAWTP